MQADLKTFQHFGVYGLTAVTCVVSETSRVVREIHPVPPAVLQDQVRLLLASYPVTAIKTGLLGSKAHIVAISEILSDYPHIPLIVDPVMVASTGDPLLPREAISAYQDRLLPMARALTPNLPEASVLLGRDISQLEQMDEAARKLAAKFHAACILKGGHLPGDECLDIVVDGSESREIRRPKLSLPSAHGTGCTLSAAIAANLALGKGLLEAVQIAGDFVHDALTRSFVWDDPSGQPIHALNQGTI